MNRRREQRTIAGGAGLAVAAPRVTRSAAMRDAGSKITATACIRRVKPERWQDLLLTGALNA